MPGNRIRAERSAERYLPYLGHIRPDILLMDDGSVLAMAEIPGAPYELAADADRAASLVTVNALCKNVADDNVTLHSAFVRGPGAGQLAHAVMSNEFAASLDRAYRERVLAGRLYQNTWYLTVIVSPRNPLGGKAGGATGSLFGGKRERQKPHATAEGIRQLEEVWQTISQTLAPYDVRRLGLRPAANGQFYFSEIAEALRLILTGTAAPVPLVSGPLGAALYTDRAIFGRRAFELRGPGVSRFGAIFGYREYPSETYAGMYDGVFSLPCPVVMVHTFDFHARHTSEKRLGLKAAQMTAANDKAKSQISDLADAQDHLASGKIAMGEHHFSLTVYADTIEELDRLSGLTRTVIANSGGVVAQESAGLEAAYFAQLPGNRKWRTRPGTITTRNFAAFSGFEAFPRGQRAGKWGPAMARFRTTAGTAYDYVPHVEDVGMTAIFGKIGQGKTTFMLFLLALFPQYFAARNGAVVFFDKDRGGELLCRAVGGRYLVVRAGRDSGLAPLKALDNTPESVAFLVQWLTALIQQDGHGPLPPEDDARLTRGVQALLRLAPDMRSLAGLRQFLDWRNPMGAGARLERWCKGGSLGWAFDGERDDVSLEATTVGFDLTAILDNGTVCAPAANYLLYRISQALDGRRFVLSCDEFNFYLLNPLFAKIWADFMLTVRKSNAVVLLATQEPAPVLDSPQGDSILRQCQTLVFCPTPGAEEHLYRKRLNFTAGEFRAIAEDMLPNSRQLLIKRHGGSAIIDFDLSALPEFVAILSSRKSSVGFVEQLRATHGDDPAAWLPAFMARFHEEVE
ncbi:VirB4 family type IV secretion/conjugal transfer ATPase [Acidiphilium sp. JA12-A1]|uniref:VirB4 family type IV secretion/conjugal transfer ATPase n=1 Tax=Acidiphilium sp. JA12-A1 TaxID=1464546 RepID=UPI0004617E52|nr:VirB4 family type IV secretion/conjugal transfer ATPase [Acidiphilium sp. JA12-A1]KDM66064.1 type IV secretion/conjugal transfer ATPase, VirB4 family [Acidiphilium sp. JA12-A1]